MGLFDRKEKLSAKESKSLLPGIKEFNKLSKAFIELLNQKITLQEKKVSTLSVMVDGMKIPDKPFTINAISADDQAKAFKKGGSIIKTKINWKKARNDSNKGVII